jgi:hypothetical protein
VYHIPLFLHVRPANQFTVTVVALCEKRLGTHGLGRRSAAERLLGLGLRIPPGACMSVSCVCVFSGTGLCNRLITHPEESYRLWCVWGDREALIMRRPWSIKGCCTTVKIRGGGIFQGIRPSHIQTTPYTTNVLRSRSQWRSKTGAYVWRDFAITSQMGTDSWCQRHHYITS